MQSHDAITVSWNQIPSSQPYYAIKLHVTHDDSHKTMRITHAAPHKHK